MLLADFSVFTRHSYFRILHYPIFILPALLLASFLPDISHEPCCILLLSEGIGRYFFSASRLIFHIRNLCRSVTKMTNSFTDPPTILQRTFAEAFFFQVTPQPFLRLVAVLILLLFLSI